ncbi:MAG TPA: adenine deaminase [Nitrososphaeria archaeon]|nr:adenine deaminase [Nitrososphaeria archaeon]
MNGPASSKPPRLKDLIKAARGLIPVDLLIENVSYVNLLTGEIYRASVGVLGDRVAYVVEGGADRLKARRRFDGRGLYAVPGLIDSHLHIESSMLTPPRFAEAVLPRGVTTVAIDPHEIANVLGKKGVKYMLEASGGLPLKIYVLAPTCVPSLPGKETSGAELTADDVEEMLGWKGVIGLAEVMDFSGVINLDPRMIEIVEAGRRRGVVIDGHCFLRGLDLNAYVAAGMEADHENFSFEDALEKLRLGMLIKLRAPYLLDVREFVNGLKSLRSPIGFLLVTDDVLPDNLKRDGHLDNVVRNFIEAGLDPIEALRASTLYPAIHLRLYDRGLIAPGRLADMVLLRSLEGFEVEHVFADGDLVASGGKLVKPIPIPSFPEDAKKTVKVRRLSLEDFKIRAPIERGKVKVRVIELLGAEEAEGAESFSQSILTRFSIEEVEVREGWLDPGALALIAVIERHGKGGGMAKGLLKGSGLREGAAASTVAHDSHNLIVVGKDPKDMLSAANKVIEMRGGVAVARGGEVIASLPLPVAGLMSEEPLEKVAEGFEKVRKALRSIGLRDHPYSPPLFFLALPVIPEAKITDRGLYSVLEQRFVSLFAE